MDNTVGGHYHLKRRIGGGSFGEVYFGEDVQTHEEVAIKLERTKTRAPQLIYESKIYLLFAGGINVPRLHWFGTESNYNVMVIDYLGKSLEDLFQQCHQKFTLKTVLMIAEQCLSALQFVHLKTFIHRDIKPDNFLVGSKARSNQIFVIDFGLSKRYKDPKTNEHIRYASGKHLTGTARYASINALKGYEQSRRDDLEALGYCLVYFLKGKLPWMGIDAKTREEKYEKIMEVKSSISPEELCEGLPEEFAQYLTLVRDLKFFEDPNYGNYRAMFRNLFIRNGFVYDYQYDWVNMFSRKSKTQSPASSANQNNSTGANVGDAGKEEPKNSGMEGEPKKTLSANNNNNEDNNEDKEHDLNHSIDNNIDINDNVHEKVNISEKFEKPQVTPVFNSAPVKIKKESSTSASNRSSSKKDQPPRPNQQQVGFKPPSAWQKPQKGRTNPWGTKK